MRSRHTILKATLELIERQGFAAVTITSAAAAAQVSRQTVYSIFGDREHLVSEAVALLALDTWSSLSDHLAATRTPLDYAVELIVAGRESVRREPVLRALLEPGPDNPVFDATMIDRARPIVGKMLEPRLSGVEAFDDVVELVARLALSVVLFDSEAVRADADLRRMLRCWLGPAL